VYSLKHYWILHKYSDGPEVFTIGDMVMPKMINKEANIYNWETLETILNDGNVFDVEMNPGENDKLELSFTVNDGNVGRIHYVFLNKNGKWVKDSYDPFEWMDIRDEDMYGKIKNALLRG
jgi:hypothetical protein